MDMGKTALAIAVRPTGVGTESHIGTGFLARASDGTPFLVTAAHVPIGTQPTADWDNWPASINLYASPALIMPVELFFDVTQFGHLPPGLHLPQIPRQPRFRFIPAGAKIGDVMAIRLNEDIQSIGHFSSSQFIQLSGVRPSHQDAAIVGYGYPYKGGTWPYAPADEIRGRIVADQNLMYLAELNVIDGHSGGPVFTDDGKFVGMIIGRNGHAKIISDRTITDVINGFNLAR